MSIVFDLEPKEAIRQQKDLSARVRLEPLPEDPVTVGGADLSFNRGSNTVFAGITVLKINGLQEIEHAMVTMEIDFPYIPGLLAYRELPPLVKAWNKLTTKPDVLVLDGHGLAHPRRMGIATHFGLLADHPTIGCAKNVLVGDYAEPGSEKGSCTDLTDGEDRVGLVLRSRTNVKPIFISPGHRVSFENTYKVIMQSLGKYKLPETTRRAHFLVNQMRIKHNAS